MAPLKKKNITVSSLLVTPKKVVRPPSKSKRSTKTTVAIAKQVFDQMAAKNGPHPSLPESKSPPKITSGPSGGVSYDVLKTLLDEQTMTINRSMAEKFDDLTAKVLNQSDKIVELESKVNSLEKDNQSIKKENEQLWKEICRPNLVFMGIKDQLGETREDLKSKVKQIIKITLNKEINFDTAFRVGNYTNDKMRPVKVKFLTVSERDEVADSRRQFKPPVYINDDLPLSVRRDHAILRNQKKQLIAEGADPKAIKIDWDRKRMQFGTKIGNIVNGNIFIKDIRKSNSQHKKNRSEANSGADMEWSQTATGFLGSH